MTSRSLHDGRSDGLVPLESLALDDVQSFAQLLRGMSRTAFAGRQLGEAFDILLEVARRPSCKLVLTISGAMTVAKQGRIVCDMLDRGLVDAVIATGALIAHGLTESIGLTHYRYDPSHSDEDLFERGYNRIYDTLEMEANLNDVEVFVRTVLNECLPDDGVWSSARLCRALGQRLQEAGCEMGQGPEVRGQKSAVSEEQMTNDQSLHACGSAKPQAEDDSPLTTHHSRPASILRSAYERGVPVFIPAFTDSEMGLDVSTWAMRQQLSQAGIEPATADPQTVFQAAPPFNPFLDLQQYARLITSNAEWAVLTIGGGVPRNWAQQIGPYVDITNARLGTQLTVPRFRYGVRICPEPVHWGGLSGCTYSEGVSWGKFVPREEGGRYAEIYADATVVWPLLMKAVFEELDRK